jgi:hypothetical protein
VVAIIFMPATLISGIFGMNFKLMPLLEQPDGFAIAIGMMATGGHHAVAHLLAPALAEIGTPVLMPAVVEHAFGRRHEGEYLGGRQAGKVFVQGSVGEMLVAFPAPVVGRVEEGLQQVVGLVEDLAQGLLRSIDVLDRS